MAKKHIALLYTGGTIGMEKTAHGYAPTPDFASALARLLTLQSDTLPHYTLHQYPEPIDSTNATPHDWQTIGRDIAHRYDDYDGFVVLHGTDTMVYTAAALSFMLQGLRKPVVVTGSQTPLGEVRSDALQNLITALQLAASDSLNEVSIYFNQRLLRGNRATKSSNDFFTAFESPNYPWLAEIGINVHMNSGALLPRPEREHFELPDYTQGRILSLRFTPGLSVEVVAALVALKPQALILECYGAGNVPDRDPSLMAVLQQANAEGIILTACSQSSRGQVSLGAYATGAWLVKAGVLGALDMTFEALYVKLHHLFARGLSPEDVKSALLTNLSGELTDPATLQLNH